MESRNNRVRERTHRLAVNVVRRVRFLQRKKKDLALTRQLLRAITSVDANVEEGWTQQSRKAFAAKMAMALQDAERARHWLRRLQDAGDLGGRGADRLLEECEELIRLLASMAGPATASR